MLEQAPTAKSYKSELVGAYVAAPLASLGFFALLLAAEPDAGFEMLILGTLIGSAVPGLVHVVNGEVARGALSWLGLPAATFGGAFVFGLISLATYGMLAGPTDNPDEEFGPSLTAAAIGGIAGCVVGAVSFAIFDVLTSRPYTRARSKLALRVGVVPRAGGAAAVLAGRF